MHTRNPGTHRAWVGTSEIQDQPDIPGKPLSFKISKMVWLNKIACYWLEQEVVHWDSRYPFVNWFMLRKYCRVPGSSFLLSFKKNVVSILAFPCFSKTRPTDTLLLYLPCTGAGLTMATAPHRVTLPCKYSGWKTCRLKKFHEVFISGWCSPMSCRAPGPSKAWTHDHTDHLLLITYKC